MPNIEDELRRKKRLLMQYQRSTDNSEHARVARQMATQYARRQGLPTPESREDIVRLLEGNIQHLGHLMTRNPSESI